MVITVDPKFLLCSPPGAERLRFRKAELQELNNGRLAMMGITGLIAQDGAAASDHIPVVTK